MSADKANKKQSTALVKSEKALKKHAAKKSLAKKHAPEHRVKKHEPKHGPHGQKSGKGGGEGKGGKDLRRAYEHLARVAVLLAHRDGEPKLRAAAQHLASLVAEDLRGAHASPKLAAELARAAEHIAFASLVTHDAKALPWSAAIEAAVTEEFRKLTKEAELPKKAKPGGERGEAIRTLHESVASAAEAARAVRNYTKAMECVRAAEALASSLEHVE